MQNKKDTRMIYKTCLILSFFIILFLIDIKTTFPKQKIVNGKPWYQSVRMFYDWIRIGEDLDKNYANNLIEKTKASNCNALTFCVQVGGYALWDSKVTPKYSRIGNMDLIGELAKLCKDNDLYFIPWWLGTSMGVARIIKEHPSWAFLGPSKKDKPGRRWHYVCYNSPYRDLIYEEIREILSKYEVDGIYFDQLPGSCYCPFCKAKFERIYNQSMPIVPEEEVVPLLHKAPPAQFPPLLREFRNNSIRGFCAGVRKIIDEVQPGICYAQNWINGDKARLGIGFVDVVLPEFYQANDLIPLGLKHRKTRAYFNNGVIWGNVRHSVYVEARHFPVRGTRMLLMDCVANHAAPIMLDLCAMDFDTTGTADLAKTYSDISKVYDYILHGEEVPYAMLLHSLTTDENYLDTYRESFEGLYRLLFEAHIPFDIITEERIQKGHLKGVKVLVIPDAAFLSDKTVNAIHNAVNKGMGLVATHQTGMRDTNGYQRAKPALSDIFGYKVHDVIANDTNKGLTINPILGVPDIDKSIFYYGSARSQHPLTNVLPKNCLFSFQGGFVACEPAANAKVIADIHPPDHSRLYADEYNRRGVFPAPARWPLAIIRKYNKARVAYFTPQADAQWRRAYAPELTTLMERTILWAGDHVPLTTPDVPHSVEVRLFKNTNKQQYTILLVNHTTNPLSPPGAAHIGVIRYVTPQKNLELILYSNGNIKNVRSLLGNKLKYKIEPGLVRLNIAKLAIYDAIIVE